jgi:hypothetical protein
LLGALPAPSFPRTQRPTFPVGGQLGLSSEAYSRPLITIRHEMHCSQHLCLNNLQQGNGYPISAGSIRCPVILRNSPEGAYCPQDMHFRHSRESAVPIGEADVQPQDAEPIARHHLFFPHIGAEISVAMICQPTQLILHKSEFPRTGENKWRN